MAALPTPSLTAQATAILEAATCLQHQLEHHGLQQPSFQVGSRQDWRDVVDYPDILKVRSALIDASNTMLSLALGPMDMLFSLTGPTVSKVDVLRTLESLGVAEAVPLEGSISIDDVAAKVGVDSRLLQQQLAFAYLMGLFYEPTKGFVAHTSMSAAMPQVSPWTRMRLGPVMSSGAWKVPDAMRTNPDTQGNIPVSLADAEGRDFWTMLEEEDPDSKGMEKFSAGMKALFAGHSGNSFRPFTQGFNWEALGDGLVVDVGGGNAHLEVNIMSEIPPDIEFLIQDLAANEAPANETIKQHGAESRIKYQVHNFFDSQPLELRPKAYLLSRILHDWQDEDCVRIVQKLIPAMERYGTKLFVSERVLPDHARDIPNHKEQAMRTQDLLMFTLFGGGERSRNEWSALFKKADPRLEISSIQASLLSQFSCIEVTLQ